MGRDRALGGVHQRANLVANLRCQHPPAFFPGPYPARGPDVGVTLHGLVDALRHGAQRIADQIRGAFQDRELGTIAEKFVSHADIVRLEGQCERVLHRLVERAERNY